MNTFVSLKAAAEDKSNPTVSKETTFQIDPRIIEIEPGFNRPISDAQVDAMELAHENGAIFPPIYVRVDAGRVIMVDGEHRWRAVMRRISKGVDVKGMSAIQFRGNDADRIAHQITSSQGNGMSPLVAGQRYLKLERLGWNRKEIAGRIGRSVSHVDECLLLALADTDVHNQIRAGQISSSTAAKVVKKHGSNAGKVISDNMVVAQASGKTKVTNATLAPKDKVAHVSPDQLLQASTKGLTVTLTFHSLQTARRFYASLSKE